MISFWFTTLSSANRTRNGAASAAGATAGAGGANAPWERPKTYSIVSNRPDCFTGFSRHRAMPSSRRRASPSCSPEDDSSTIGVGAEAQIGRRRCASSYPLIPGICTSSSARENRFPSAAARSTSSNASDPPHAITGTMPQCRSTSSRIRRLVALSDTSARAGP